MPAEPAAAPPVTEVDRIDLITPSQLARRHHTSEGVLSNRRSAGTGIPYVKLGRRVYYRLEDVVAAEHAGLRLTDAATA